MLNKHLLNGQSKQLFVQSQSEEPGKVGGLELSSPSNRAVQEPLGKAEARGLRVQGQPKLHSRFQGCLGYTARLLSLEE